MRTIRVAAFAALLLVAAACGSTDDSSHNDGHSATTTGSDAARTIEIEMQDIKYVPDSIEVTDGETVRLVFTNTGEADHDAFIGDEAAQDDHDDERGEMDGGHVTEDLDAITVEPGDTGELTHTFHGRDEVLIGCHEPGHYDAGMGITVEVR